MSKGFDLLAESGSKALKQLENYREAARKVKSILNTLLTGFRVYVFGSVTKGRQTAMSDIDILIVVDGVTRDQAYEVEAKIYSSIDAPIELHVASTEEFNRWYSKFIDKLEEI